MIDQSDSGGQYLDGTIDTTRTQFYGKKVPDDVKRAYTRVLQCHIAASTAKFPSNADANQLVMLGKAALYQDGLDYGHGLGHGIGSYLGVHEGECMQPAAMAYSDDSTYFPARVLICAWQRHQYRAGLLQRRRMGYSH